MSQNSFTKEEEHRFIAGIRDGDIPFEEAMKQYHNFIWDFVNKYKIAGLERDDIYSLLIAELYQAIMSFDEKVGVGFMSYLGRCFVNKLSLEITSSKRKKGGAEAYNRAFRLDKLVPATVGEDNVTYRDILLTGDYTNEQVNSNLLFSVFYEALEQENERDRYIVTELLLKQRTQQDLGRELGVSQTRIRQIYLRSMKTIRQKLAHNGYTSSLSVQ